MASGQLMEELLIERVTLLTAARRHENVASNELMNDFTVSRYAAEGDVHVPFKLDGHLDKKAAEENISMRNRLGVDSKKKIKKNKSHLNTTGGFCYLKMIALC